MGQKIVFVYRAVYPIISGGSIVQYYDLDVARSVIMDNRFNGWNSHGCSVLWGGKFMKKSNTNILLYLLLVVGLWAFCFVTLKLLLMPYSVAYTEYGKMTVGYFFVEHMAITFEYLVPTLAEFQNRKLSSKIIYIW